MTREGASNNPGRQEPDEKVRQLQRKLYVAAKQQKERRFHALYDRMWRSDVLHEAWERVKRRKGAGGVDGVTLEAVEQYGVEKLVLELQDKLRAGTYRAPPVLRRYIPKADGKQRPLGIPTVKDRVVQMAAKLVLEPIFEADFLPSSFGFRPRKSTLQALETIRETVNAGSRFVLDADIRDYFGTIDQTVLMERVSRRVSDRRVHGRRCSSNGYRLPRLSPAHADVGEAVGGEADSPLLPPAPNPSPPAPAAFRIEGQVVDAKTRAAIPSAALEFEHDQDQRTIATNERGHFSLATAEAGAWILVKVRARGYATSRREQPFDRSTTNLKLELTRIPERHGRVLDTAGRPIEGALIETFLTIGADHDGFIKVVTDPQGEFRLGVDGLVGLGVSHQCCLSADVDVGPPEAELTITLQPAKIERVTFKGRVVDEDEKGVEGAQVSGIASLRDPEVAQSIEVTTGVDGRFEVELAARPVGSARREHDRGAALPGAGRGEARAPRERELFRRTRDQRSR